MAVGKPDSRETSLRSSRRYDYECSNGHGLYNCKRPRTKCNVTPHGEPCTGTLKRVGEGSRKGEE